MDTTIFLAQLWGPVILAVGIGFFVSRDYYLKIYRDIEKAPFAALIFGMAAMATGIAQISVHNVWEGMPAILVTLLGWGLLLKGATFAILPRVADEWGDWAADSKLIPAAGIVMLVLGGYLTWVAYLG